MRYLLALLLLGLALAFAPAAQADRRVALVVGNSAYQNTSILRNSKNDATDMAAALTRLGFEVIDGMDLDKRSMERIIRLFATKLGRADIALFYYAGHGLQVDGQNYLVPVDARMASEGDVDFEGLPLGLVLKQMEREATASIVLLDACRDNPLARNLTRRVGARSSQLSQGLAEVKVGVGTLVGFSTQPGNIALDGEGRNSPYASALLKHVEVPGKDISALLVAVRSDVLLATGGKQVPWEHTSLTGEVHLKPAGVSSTGTGHTGAAATGSIKPFVPDYDKETEIAFWNAVKDSKSPAVLQTYLDRFPGGTFAGLARVMIDQHKHQQGGQQQGSKVAAAVPRLVEPTPAPPATNPVALARALQGELKRVGCDPGSIEGSWGPKSKEALRKFERFSKMSVATEEPTETALQAVAGQKGRICPLECGRGQYEADGRCVAQAKQYKRQTDERPQKQDRQQEPNNSGPRVCIGRGSVAFCTN